MIKIHDLLLVTILATKIYKISIDQLFLLQTLHESIWKVLFLTTGFLSLKILKNDWKYYYISNFHASEQVFSGQFSCRFIRPVTPLNKTRRLFPALHLHNFTRIVRSGQKPLRYYDLQFCLQWGVLVLRPIAGLTCPSCLSQKKSKDHRPFFFQPIKFTGFTVRWIVGAYTRHSRTGLVTVGVAWLHLFTYTMYVYIRVWHDKESFLEVVYIPQRSEWSTQVCQVTERSIMIG